VVETEVTVGAVVSVVEELSVLAELAVLLSLDDEHEEISSVMLTTKTNEDNKLFILFLYRKCLRSKD
jgi:hypothetical protein